MRGLLIVNPNATTTDDRVRDVLIAALRSVLDLEAVTTEHRGHAGELARAAASNSAEVLVTLGGDGTIHEVVNGLMDVPAGSRPALATIPGGSANVFARATGLPNDPVAATGSLLRALRMRRYRAVGLGRANGRWFTSNAGLGLDAEVIAAMERQRAKGKAATPLRYLSTAARQYFTATDRRNAAMTVQPNGADPFDRVFIAIIQNCAPWTYLGGLPVNACPRASFETGLDAFCIRDLGVVSSAMATGRILRSSGSKPRLKSLVLTHDAAALSVICDWGIALQVDGESLGQTQHVEFTAVPGALRIVDGSEPGARKANVTKTTLATA